VTRPVVVVLGAGADAQPAGIEGAADDVDLVFAADGDALVELGDRADGLFFFRASGAWLRAAWPLMERLRWIHSASDGVDAVLFPDLVASEVVVTNSRGVFDASIAEWVIGAMLAFATRILDQRDAQLQGRWIEGTTERLGGRHVLVVGPGPIGRAVADRASALGMSVELAGRAARIDDRFGAVVSTMDVTAFDRALSRADYVVDALPLTSATDRLFDEGRFGAMKSTTRFLNVGRGDTVDETALVGALTSGSIGGAALDVFHREPLPEASPLWALPQVLISPHMCGDFDGWEWEVMSVFCENATRFARGEPLRNIVDKAAGHGVG
jgi:phosphoglycerate dehydrogenase-like enzyme